MSGEIQFENGNIHNAVIVIGDDPANEDNVLVSRLAGTISVPKDSISPDEGTPEPASN